MPKSSPDDTGDVPEPASPTPEPAVDAFVLDDFSAADVARMQIIPPGRYEPVGWIDFAGPGHAKSRAAAEVNTRRVLKELQQKELNPRHKPKDRSMDDLEEQAVKQVVDRIVNWSIRGRAEDGQIVDLRFTPERGMELLKDPRKGWFYIDCNNFLNNIENFMPASSQS